MSSTSSLETTLQRLRELRQVLLRLHKALLELERVGYEQTHDRIQSTGQFFQLVLEDDWFKWLRPMSQLIVQIDETLSAKEPVELSQAEQLLQQARELLRPSETGTATEQRYYNAIQRDPDVALMNAEASRILQS